MSLVIEFRQAARFDFDEAADWYSAEDPALRDRFIDAIDQTIAAIVRSPASYPIVSGTRIRRAVVREFPFLIFFWFDSFQVVVISVFHTSRNPIIWRGRTD
jgi:toxin ParE1/3/4